MLSNLEIEETISGGSVANSIYSMSKFNSNVCFTGKVSNDKDSINEPFILGSEPYSDNINIIDGLENLERSIFTFDLVDGIILMDHSPNIDPIYLKILECISLRIPIHQLCYHGSHRLGYHGLLIYDIHPVKSSADLPSSTLASPISLAS